MSQWKVQAAPDVVLHDKKIELADLIVRRDRVYKQYCEMVWAERESLKEIEKLEQQMIGEVINESAG